MWNGAPVRGAAEIIAHRLGHALGHGTLPGPEATRVGM